jgi:hypothetical protein
MSHLVSFSNVMMMSSAMVMCHGNLALGVGEEMTVL